MPRDLTSNHAESIRTRPTDIWPRHWYNQNFRPALNFDKLTSLVHLSTGNDASRRSSSVNKGKKRSALPNPPDQRKSKRTKTSSKRGQVVEVVGVDAEADAIDGHAWQYPLLENASVADAELAKNIEHVPVLRHVLEIQYTDAANAHDIEGDVPSRWKTEMESFREVLDTLCGSNSLSVPKTVDLGDVRFAVYNERLIVVSDVLRSHTGKDDWMLLVPSLTKDVDHDALDFSSSASKDWLTACHALKSVGKASIGAKLKLVILPSQLYNHSASELPFRLQLEINVSLIIPTIFEPLSRKETRKKKLEVDDAQRRVLRLVYGSETPAGASFHGTMNISFFYSVLGSAPSLPSPEAQEAMQPNDLLPTLLPFQRRSVAWLLDREGKTITSEGEIVAKQTSTEFSFWDKIEEGNYTWYLNRLSGTLLPNMPPDSNALGGILAEEPGLGKTLETIALIMLNPAPPEMNPDLKRWDPEARLDVKAIKTSLIVTPPALASQWRDELTAHAPSLKVLFYDGWSKVRVPITQSELEENRLADLKAAEAGKLKAKKRSRKRKDKQVENDRMDIDEDLMTGENGEVLDWCSYVHQFDVVITTYQVLRSDLNVARAALVRPRREDVVYTSVERPRSPLVMVEWNRVIMDEVQMVGGGKTEDMVSLIPRRSSLAVSGTPARAQVSDLMHILKFLRVNNIIGSMRLWHRLLLPGFSTEFAKFFQKYAIRTMKVTVKDELTIPEQTRFLVPIELGKVERHVYDRNLETILGELGLDARGVAASSGWQVDGTLLRSSLRRLRGICTHPQVGQLQRKGDNLFRPGALKTIEAVLESLRDQNWRNIMEDWKSKIQRLVHYAQLQQFCRGNNRYQQVLETLLLAEKETNGHIQEINNALAEHDAKGDILKREAAALRGAHLADPSHDEETSREKGKGRQISEETEDVKEDSAEKDLPRTPAGEEHKVKRRALQQRLREGRLLLHRVKFLLGDVYHVLGGSSSVLEDSAYVAAEKIRRGLLAAAEDEATRAMAHLEDGATSKRFNKGDLLIEVPFLGKGGIRSADLMEEANEVVENVLNAQTILLWEWRSRITGLLTQKLNAGEEADGQEYQRTLDNQGEAETFLQAYTALLADRREALVNERTLLAAHDVREKKLRHTMAAIKAANAADNQLAVHEDVEFQPEHEVLHRELSDQRKDILQRLGERAIKSILMDLNAAGVRIIKETDPEKVLIGDAVSDVRRLISEQGAMQDKLDADLVLIRKAFNERILYFRQLQEISDSVMEVQYDGNVAEAIAECLREKNELDTKINTSRARLRYLENIAKARDDGVIEEEDETCILCRCEFARGFITQCAHVFCEGCMKAWLLRKGKTCPVCRVGINPDTVQRFAVNADGPQVEPPPRPINGEPAPRSLRQIIYNKIDPVIYDQIQTMESFGDFGSKIQTLVRHLLYLQLTDPGAKSIVFSAWADSLHIVEWALQRNNIPCLRIDQNSKGDGAAKKFRTDPNVLVLLLHGERENAGLNVTCASRVFLLESVVHHSFEIQAIARIDRMGQTRHTEVYCYYAEDTVEKNILDLAARQGLSLYTKDKSEGTLNLSSFASDNDKMMVDSPMKKVQKGDFIFKIDDMLAILFPHMFEDLDYLLPPQDTIMGDISGKITAGTAYGAGSSTQPPLIGSTVGTNAIAGPSGFR